MHTHTHTLSRSNLLLDRVQNFKLCAALQVYCAANCGLLSGIWRIFPALSGHLCPHPISAHLPTTCCNVKKEMQSIVRRSAGGFKVCAKESGLGWQGWSFSQRRTGNVIVFNNPSLMITHTLMMVSCGLCLCALTPSAGETGDQDLMQSVVGQTWNRVPPRLQRRVVYLLCSRQQHKQTTWCVKSEPVEHLPLSGARVRGSVRGRAGSLGTPVRVAAHRWGFNSVCKASRGGGLSQQRRCCVCFAGV